MPTTYHVATTGNDADAGSEAAPWLTLDHALVTIASTDTVLIEDGTYEPTAIMNFPEALINTIWMSNSQDKSKVTIDFTMANNLRYGITPRAADEIAKTTFKHLTIKQTAGGTGINTTYLVYAAFGSEDAGIVFEDCDLSATEHGLAYLGAASAVRRCKVNWFDNGATPSNNKGIHGRKGGVEIDSCLITNWKINAIDLPTVGTGAAIRNCTIIGHPTEAGTRGVVCEVGIQIYNSIIYSYAAGASYNEGFRFDATDATNTIKNCIAFGTFDSSEYVRCGAPTVFDQLETQTEVTASGQNVFVDLAGGDYLPDVDGIAYQRGSNASYPTTDLNGNPFNDPPTIGCLEDPAPAGGGVRGESPGVNNLNNLNNLKL